MQFTIDGPMVLAASAASAIIIAEIIRVVRSSKDEDNKQSRSREYIKGVAEETRKILLDAITKLSNESKQRDLYWRDRTDNENKMGMMHTENIEKKLSEILDSLIDLIRQL